MLSGEDAVVMNKKRLQSSQAKNTERQKTSAIGPLLIEQFQSGRLQTLVSSIIYLFPS
jgi:hypothetical protein